MLEEKSIIDQITLTNTGHIMCRQSNLILKNGVEISRTYHRATFYPGQEIDMALFSGDVSEEDEANIIKGFDELIASFDEIADKTETTMPLLTSSMKHSIQIVKLYKEAFNATKSRKNKA